MAQAAWIKQARANAREQRAEQKRREREEQKRQPASDALRLLGLVNVPETEARAQIDGLKAIAHGEQPATPKRIKALISELVAITEQYVRAEYGLSGWTVRATVQDKDAEAARDGLQYLRADTLRALAALDYLD